MTKENQNTASSVDENTDPIVQQIVQTGQLEKLVTFVEKNPADKLKKLVKAQTFWASVLRQENLLEDPEHQLEVIEITTMIKAVASLTALFSPADIAALQSKLRANDVQLRLQLSTFVL